ncbi:GNAT family N-acetyltransferase [Streptomyces sioyaensis]|uniref:GNAT family N-acetyltransferase n=1 Tax=Streptomyces sioyaensis TaxID=67364 RepID=UPI0037CEE3D7
MAVVQLPSPGFCYWRNMPYTIRPAIAEDARDIARLLERANDLRATAEHIATHIREHAQFEAPFVAESKGWICGIVCLRLLPNLCDERPYAELTELLVHPEYRRQGIGRSLIERVEAEATAQGADELVFMTAWRNTDAHSFYHALGYRLYTIMMRRSLIPDGK